MKRGAGGEGGRGRGRGNGGKVAGWSWWRADDGEAHYAEVTMHIRCAVNSSHHVNPAVVLLIPPRTVSGRHCSERIRVAAYHTGRRPEDLPTYHTGHRAAAIRSLFPLEYIPLEFVSGQHYSQCSDSVCADASMSSRCAVSVSACQPVWACNCCFFCRLYCSHVMSLLPS